MLQVIGILLGALLSGSTSLCLGTYIFRRLLIKAEWLECYSLAFVVGSACLSQVVFFLCAAGLAHQQAFLAVGLFAAIAAARPGRRTEKRPHFPSLPQRWKWPLGLLFTLFGIVYLVNALAPEMSPDGSAYHLPLVARYLSAHAFIPITDNLYASLSQGIELVFLPAFSIGGSSATAVVHLLFLLDLALLMISYGRHFGFPVPALVAAFLVFASPVVAWDGTSAYNDVATATVVFGLFYFLQIWDENQTARLLIPIGILAGGSYAAKYTAAIALPYALGFMASRLRRAGKPMARPILTVSAVAAFFILPWMIKNLIYVGNPVAPFANVIFPNQYVHVSFEQQYLANLRHYRLTSLLQAPWELTVKGERLQGFFGPIFLLMPLALLSLRQREGRRLLWAGAVFAIPWLSNIGTRFLIPAIPPLTLALALALAHPVALLPATALLHALLSWFSPPLRYFDPYAPRITSFPILAALRIESEDVYLARRSSGYLVDRLVESAVPPSETVFSFDPVPEAWTTRKIRIGYYSAENEVLMDILRTAMIPSLWPERAVDLYFPPTWFRGLRVIRTGPSDARMWQISELQLFSANTPIRPDGNWHYCADPNPWDAHFAFDNSLVTRWQSWRSAAPGMFLGVSFSEPKRIDRVRLLIPTGTFQSQIALQRLDPDGHWCNVPVGSFTSSVRVTENLRAAAVRAFLDRGIRYLLVSQNALGANEFAENSSAWGIQRIGEAGGTRLYFLKTGHTGLPPPDSVSSAAEPAIPPGMYDDTDPRIALHAPWMRDTQFQEAYRHTLAYTNIPDASISLRFTGSSFTYVYTRAHNRGIAEVWIDGRLKGHLDLYASDTEWQSRTTYGALSPGTHTIRIRVTGQHFLQASDCFVDLDAIIVQ
jgi:hypothetical protein